jgi:hypothetical protein
VQTPDELVAALARSFANGDSDLAMGEAARALVSEQSRRALDPVTILRATA